MHDHTEFNTYNSFFYEAEMDFDNVFHLYISRGNNQFWPTNNSYSEIYVGRKLN